MKKILTSEKNKESKRRSEISLNAWITRRSNKGLEERRKIMEEKMKKIRY